LKILGEGSDRERSKEDFTVTVKLPQNLQFKNVLTYTERNHFVPEVFPAVLLKVKSNC